jgi:tRNA A-37 threonylcarbamoyl transferase component Bud32
MLEPQASAPSAEPPRASAARGAEPEVVRVLKRDALGRVELVRCAGALAVRRAAVGGSLPLSRRLARVLLARERSALRALEGLPGVARVLAEAPDGAWLLRSFVPGTPLCLASELPRDFFERLEELVRALHERGVCHNDLHKEANVLVGEDGHPALVDFQLASRHARRGRAFAVCAREDLRHVWKHRSYYLRALGEVDPLPAAPPRSPLAEGWRRFGKPLYRSLTGAVALRSLLGGDEPRRGKHGPWPR